MVGSSIATEPISGEGTVTVKMTSSFSICSYVASGDADGKLTVWEWKTTRIATRFKAHDSVCIGTQWLPHETSKVITCGWDGAIKLWD